MKSFLMNVSAYLIWLMLLFLLKKIFFLAQLSYFTFLERLKYGIKLALWVT